MLHPTEKRNLVLLVPLLERVQWSCLRFRPQRNQSPVDILPRSVHRGVLEETVRTLSSRSGRPHWPPDPALRSGRSHHEEEQKRTAQTTRRLKPPETLGQAEINSRKDAKAQR